MLAMPSADHPGGSREERSGPVSASAPRMPRVPISTFIGRDWETSEVARLVRDERLVTILGTGGIGKTRLAHQVVGQVGPSFRDGVRWVELAPIGRAEDLALAVLRAGSGSDAGEHRVLDALAAEIGGRIELLVLDNCEHVVNAAAELCVTLLMSCPDLHVLATSRAPLEAPGEVSWRIPPMSRPGVAMTRCAEDLMGSDATELFVDRARRVRSTIVLDEHGCRAITELCDRLGGLPLAIELAAARCRSLEPAQVLDGLQDSMRLLVGPGRTGPGRQRTLQASIEWSYELLEPNDRTVLRRLSVFAGSFSPDAATAVAGEGFAAFDVMNAVERLVAGSLIELEVHGGAARYRLLEPLRQFARRRLDEIDDLEGTADAASCVRRHREHFLTIVNALNRRFVGGVVDDVVKRLVLERDEVRAALDRMADAGEWEAFGAAVWPLGIEWSSRGLIRQVLTWLDRYLDAARDRPSSTRARVLYARGNAWIGMGNFVAAAADLSAAVAMGREVDDDLVAGRATSGLAFVLALVDPAAASVLIQEAIERLQRAGDVYSQCRAYCNEAIIHLATCRFGAADDSLSTAERLLDKQTPNHTWGWVWLIQGLRASLTGDTTTALRCAGQTELATRELEIAEFRALIVYLRATAMIQRAEPSIWVDALAEEVAQTQRDGVGLAELLLSIVVGLKMYADGDIEEAHRTFARLVETSSALGIRYFTTWTMLLLADVQHARGDPDAALATLDDATATLAELANIQFQARADRRRAALLAERGEFAESRRLLRLALDTDVRIGDHVGLVTTLDMLQVVALADHHWADLARAHSIGERLRTEHQLGIRLEPERSRVHGAVAAARAHIGTALDELIASARDLEPTMAIATDRAPSRTRLSADHGWDALTPAELRVADLIGEGLTNAEIGQRLFLSRDTVKTHIAHILTKLAVTNRTQIAAQLVSRRAGQAVGGPLPTPP
jgi:predicted ATPase/DNA-binding CsgD family transcriptional regulator